MAHETQAKSADENEQAQQPPAGLEAAAGISDAPLSPRTVAKREATNQSSPGVLRGNASSVHVEATATATAPVTGSPEAAHPPQSEHAAAAGANEVPSSMAQYIVNSQDVLDAVAHFKRQTVGTVVYEPRKPLARNYELYLNSMLRVRIAKRHLSRKNEAVARRALWGTDVYTDDSDVVACLYQSGMLKEEPEHDIWVMLLILPELIKYQGSYQNGVNSRTWTSPHDGVSFKIYSVHTSPLGSAETPICERSKRLADWVEAYSQCTRPKRRLVGSRPGTPN